METNTLDCLDLSTSEDVLEVYEIASAIPPSKSPVGETKEFMDRLPDPSLSRDIKRAIIREWMTSCYHAHEALHWLRALGLYTSRQKASNYDTMCLIARAEFGDVRLPEPPKDPSPPAASYATPEIIETLADVRGKAA